MELFRGLKAMPLIKVSRETVTTGKRNERTYALAATIVYKTCEICMLVHAQLKPPVTPLRL
jgi:hypothetical protein